MKHLLLLAALLLAVPGCKTSKPKTGGEYANHLAGLMQEYKTRLGIPANVRIPKVSAVELKPGVGKNRDGWYIPDYGGVHGVNWSGCSAGTTRFLLATDPNTGKPDEWTMRHEALHPVLNDMLCYPGGAHGFVFVEGNGNPGHPQYIIDPTGRRHSATSLIGGRWPARTWTAIKEVFIPGSPGDEFRDRAFELYIDTE